MCSSKDNLFMDFLKHLAIGLYLLARFNTIGEYKFNNDLCISLVMSKKSSGGICVVSLEEILFILSQFLVICERL